MLLVCRDCDGRFTLEELLAFASFAHSYARLHHTLDSSYMAAGLASLRMWQQVRTNSGREQFVDWCVLAHLELACMTAEHCKLHLSTVLKDCMVHRAQHGWPWSHLLRNITSNMLLSGRMSSSIMRVLPHAIILQQPACTFPCQL